MNRRSRASLLFSSIGGGFLLAACGGAGDAKMPAKAAEPQAEREPTTVAEAQEQIERASAELASRADKKFEADHDSPAADSTATSKPTSPGGGVREETAKTTALDACSNSCRALSSMRRAVTALCRMTGDEDTRCSDAKKTLKDNESRVARCHCST